MDRYQIYHGDCLDILPTLEAGSVDAVIADTPYGTTACKWDSVIPFEPMWAGIKHVLKPRGAAVLFGSQPFTSALVMSNVDWFKYCWVWEKNTASSFQNARIQPMRNHEDILIFFAGMATYNPIKQQTKSKAARQMARNGVYVKRKNNHQNGHGLGTKAYESKFMEYVNPVTVQKFKCVHRHKILHPTQKPAALMEYLIKTYTNEGETVLDFTMGSGTTGVAAMRTSRRFIGIELDAEYYRIAEQRIKNAAGEFVLTDKEKQTGQLALWGSD